MDDLHPHFHETPLHECRDLVQPIARDMASWILNNADLVSDPGIIVLAQHVRNHVEARLG